MFQYWLNLQITKFWAVAFKLFFEQLDEEMPYRKKGSMVPQICESNHSFAKISLFQCLFLWNQRKNKTIIKL